MFARFGFTPCNAPPDDLAIPTIALFEKPRLVPTHAALRLESGTWSSKMGMSHDITHNLDDLSDSDYGNVSVFLQRDGPVRQPAISSRTTGR
jgi:hypothetical protein